jgi:hypothetical protein
MTQICRLVAVVFLAFGFAACNVFEGFYDEGTSTDVDVLLGDASMAMQRGDYRKAVEILENAHAVDPAHAVVRVDLASALFRANNISVLDILNVADHIRNGDVPEWAGKSASTSCSFQGGIVRGEFRYEEVEAFDKLLDNEATFARVSDLLYPLVPSILNVLRVGEEYDRELILENLRSTGLTKHRIDSMLLTFALSVVVDSYILIFNTLPDVTWYHLEDGSGRDSIGYCVSSEEARETIENLSACAIRRLARGVIALDLRLASLAEAEGAREVADAALEAFQRLELDLGNYDLTCN